MTAFSKYQHFSENVGKALVDFTTHALKVALTNAPPNAANHQVFGDIGELAAGFGYLAGGTAAALTSWTEAAGVAKLVLVDAQFTAAGGSIGPFQYAVLYDSVSDVLIGYYDYGVPITLTDTNVFIVDFDAGTGVLTLT